MLLNYLDIKNILYTKKFEGIQGPSSQTKSHPQFSAILSSVLILSQEDSLFNKLTAAPVLHFIPSLSNKVFLPQN